MRFITFSKIFQVIGKIICFTGDNDLGQIVQKDTEEKRTQ